MSHIDKQATIDAIRQKAKDELADVNHYFLEGVQLAVDVVEGMPEPKEVENGSMPCPDARNSHDRTTDDCISRQAAIDVINESNSPIAEYLIGEIMALPSAQPDLGKYEYHYDHTDCIWYRPEARNRCPTTCAQYRDGWNDAMNYIFRDGKGYRPYRRGEQYGE